MRLSHDGPKTLPPRRGGRGIGVSCFHGLRSLADSLAPPVAKGQRLSGTRAGDAVGKEDAGYALQPAICIDSRTDFTLGWLSSKCLRRMAKAFLKLAQAAARSPSW